MLVPLQIHGDGINSRLTLAATDRGNVFERRMSMRNFQGSRTSRVQSRQV